MYADYIYYTDEFKGILISKDETNLLENASDEVDDICFGRICGKGFENLTVYQQELIKKAVCQQAEFTKKYGAFLESPVSGYSISKTSMSFDSKKINGVYTTDSIIRLLNRTGLTCLVP